MCSNGKKLNVPAIWKMFEKISTHSILATYIYEKDDHNDQFGCASVKSFYSFLAQKKLDVSGLEIQGSFRKTLRQLRIFPKLKSLYGDSCIELLH